MASYAIPDGILGIAKRDSAHHDPYTLRGNDNLHQARSNLGAELPDRANVAANRRIRHLLSLLVLTPQLLAKVSINVD
jgi:hypothetical protein